MGHMNTQDALRRMADDEELFREVVSTYLEDMPKRLEELDRAVDRVAVGDAARLAHTIKGASDNVGAETMRDAARRLMDAFQSPEGGFKDGVLLDIRQAWRETSREIESILGA